MKAQHILSFRYIAWDNVMFCGILVPFMQSKKHPCRSVNLLKVALFHRCFSRFLDCTNGTKSHKASHKIFLFFS